MARDKRVIAAAVISPLISVLLTFLGFGIMAGDLEPQRTAQPARRAPEMGEEAPPLAVLRVNGSYRLLSRLKSTPPLNKVKVTLYPNLASAEVALAQGKAGMILIPPTNGDLALERDRGIVWTTPDTGRGSPRTRAATLAALRALNAAVRDEVLTRHNLTADAVEPWRIVSPTTHVGKPVASRETPGLLSLLVPYIMVLAAFFGGVPSAFDMVAGEKERGTLETLLVSPVPRRAIVYGKFLAVFCVCTVAACSALGGVAVAVNGNFLALKPLLGDSHLSAANIGGIMVTFLPLNVTYAAVLLVVSTFARNQREAQSYLMPLTLLVVVPAMFTFFSGFGARGVQLTSALIPVYSSSSLIRMILDEGPDPAFLAVTVLATSSYALITLWLATRMFLRERVLMRL